MNEWSVSIDHESSEIKSLYPDFVFKERKRSSRGGNICF